MEPRVALFCSVHWLQCSLAGLTGRGVLESCMRGGSWSGKVAANRPQWRGPSPGESAKAVVWKSSCILDYSFKMAICSLSSLICPFSSIRRSSKCIILVHLEQIKALSVKSSSGTLTNMVHNSHFITFGLLLAGLAGELCSVMFKNDWKCVRRVKGETDRSFKTTKIDKNNS